jgi:hypothetical protein
VKRTRGVKRTATILYLLQFSNLNVIDNIATLTTDVSVFKLLSVGDKSLGVEAPVSIKVVNPSRLGAHHTKLHVSLCLTSGGDPPSRLVRGFLVTANMNEQCDATSIQESTHSVMTKSVNRHQVIVMSKHHFAIGCSLHSSHGDRACYGR